MFWQKEMLRENVGMTLNDTYILELPDYGLLSGLFVRITGSDATGLGQSGGSWRIIDFISKMEIILNGALICKSLKGDMVQAVSFYDDKIISPDAWRNYATNMQSCYMLINFGRAMFDMGMGLDLGKFKTVEFKLTNNASASYFSDLTISVMALWAREHDAGFPMYMRTEEWRNWTTVADETKYLDIPSEHILRRILLQAIPSVDADNVEKTGMHNLMDDIELTLRSGMTRVYKGGIDDIMRLNLFTMGRNLFTGGFPYMSADKGINMGLGYVNMIAHGAGSSDGAGAATIPTMESGRTSFTQKPETYEADSPICLIAGGMAYHNTVLLEFDVDLDPATWIDPHKEATVKLDIHTRNSADAASGTAKVVLDRAVATPAAA